MLTDGVDDQHVERGDQTERNDERHHRIGSEPVQTQVFVTIVVRATGGDDQAEDEAADEDEDRGDERRRLILNDGLKRMANSDESLDGEGDDVDGREQLGEVAEARDGNAELGGRVAEEVSEATAQQNDVEQQITER